MKIGIDASRANRDHKGGVEWYSYYLIRALAEIDSKNEYILYTDKPLKGGLLDLTSDDSRQYGGVKIDKDGFQEIKSHHDNFKAKILKWPFNFFWTIGRLSLEMIFNRPDALFIPAHTLPIFFPKKTVMTIHDIGFERDRRLYSKEGIGPDHARGKKILDLLVRLYTGGKYGANKKDYLSWSTEFALKHTKKIITVSEFSKKEIVEIYGAKPEKIGVVHHGYNNDLYKKIEDKEKVKKVLDKYGIDFPYIFYVGRLEKKKNILSLIEAFYLMRKENKDIKHKLLLAGDASFGFDEIKFAMREDDEIILPGWVDEEDMPYFYNGATLFAFPSFYEGFGIPLLQSMACGVPILASDVASIPEVVDGSAVLVDPLDVKSMADAMARIIRDADLRDKLIRNGSERVKDFSWERCARETLKEIEGL